MTRRIGVFGGTFDPVHTAHVALADTAMRHLRLDELRWVPAGNPWQKAGAGISPAAEREAMVRAAIAGRTGHVLDARELARTGPSYTADTLREIAAQQPGDELFLVIGQDQYERLHTWHDWREILRRCTLAVAARDAASFAVPESLAGVPHRVEHLPMPSMPVSATAVRAHIASGGRARDLVPDVVPAEVASYIDRQHLYRPPSPPTPAPAEPRS